MTMNRRSRQRSEAPNGREGPLASRPVDNRTTPLDAPRRGREPETPEALIRTRLGTAYLGDSASFLRNHVRDGDVDLIVTSPPFGLVRKKDYGNADADEYVDWFRPFAEQFRRVLKESGSLVIDIGGAWKKGLPTKSLYQYELLITLCKEFEFHLAQEFFWWNPSRLPTPAEWVTVRRIRVKDAVNTIFWLSPSPWPKASNRRVLQPYSSSMHQLLANGYRPKRRPSGHEISTNFSRNNGAAIPPNLIAMANTESNSRYLKYCELHDIRPHPARYPAVIPEYFMHMLTDEGDLVIDPFAGSCVTGEVAERLKRRWRCIELEKQYLEGAAGRFEESPVSSVQPISGDEFYKVPRPGLLWNGTETQPLLQDGGRQRPPKRHTA